MDEVEVSTESNERYHHLGKVVAEPVFSTLKFALVLAVLLVPIGVIGQFFAGELPVLAVISAVLLILAAFMVNYLTWLRKGYTIEANRDVKSSDGQINKHPGNVIIYSGLISKRIETHSLEEFSRVELRKDIFGLLSGASDIYLRGDKVVKLENVKNAEGEIMLIQHLLDELKTNLQNTRMDFTQ